jgi:hypothetical protein
MLQLFSIVPDKRIIRAQFCIDNSVELSLRNYFALCGTHFQNIDHSIFWVAKDRVQSFLNIDWDI